MNLFLHRRVLCLVAASACLISFVPARAGAVSRPRSTYPTRSSAPRRSAAAPKLTYYGGHVLSHVKVDVVVWGSWSYGSTVPLTGSRSVSGFFGGITKSAYVDWLNEYDTPTQSIGRGSLDGVYTVHPPSADNGATVTSAQLADAMKFLIHSGALPRPTTNRLYAIFFRSGQEISTPFGNSVNDFCAFHDSVPYLSSTAYIAVMPFELSNRGCRPASTSLDNVTTIASHELVESITDPGVGLDRLAWYDQSNGEIGDICAGVSAPARVAGADGVPYMVQREWSNRSRSCIVSR